jgi:hypothetical protein
MNFLKAAVGAVSALMGRGRALMTQVWGARVGDPPVRGTKEFLEVYETSPWVRAVAGKTATAVGATKWTLEANGAPVTDHLLLRALRKPNPLMSGHQLIKITQLCLDLVGDAFWLKARNAFGTPVEFYPIPPHWITELPTPGRPYYRVSYFGWQELIPDTEIFRLQDAGAANPYGRGAGLVRAQADELETAEYASKHAKQIFWNRAIPEFVVMDPGAGEDEVARHEQGWAQRLQGFWRWYKPYFTNRKLEFWQPQQMNLENLTMVPLMKHERDTIVQAWGFPPEQLGIVENSNRATIDGSDYIFESRLVKPRRETIRDAIQSGLVPEYDERLVIGFVDTVPEDKEHALNVAKAAPHALTIDEWRSKMGMKPLGGDLGGAYLVPLASYVTTDPLDQESRPKTGGGAPAPDGEPGRPAKIWRSESRAIDKVLEVLRELVARPPQPITLSLKQGDVHVDGAETLVNLTPRVTAEVAAAAPPVVHNNFKAEMPARITVAVDSVPATTTTVTKRGDRGIDETKTEQV